MSKKKVFGKQTPEQEEDNPILSDPLTAEEIQKREDDEREANQHEVDRLARLEAEKATLEAQDEENRLQETLKAAEKKDLSDLMQDQVADFFKNIEDRAEAYEGMARRNGWTSLASDFTTMRNAAKHVGKRVEKCKFWKRADEE